MIKPVGLPDAEYQQLFAELEIVRQRIRELTAAFPASLRDLTPAYLQESAQLSKRLHELEGRLAAADHLDMRQTAE